MGLLDDASRDHLELKRRHGASEQEVAQKEAEVLGPARREPAVTDEGGESPSTPDQPAPATKQPRDWGAEIFADESARPRAYAVPATPVDEEPPSTASEAEPSAEEVAQPPEEPAAPADEPPEPSGGAPIWRSLGDAAPSSAPAAGQRGWLDEDLPPSSPSDHEQPAAAAEHPSERQPRGEEPQAERRPGEEDVLEETPDFLQETPEHERLWFEQKPPRDFDFDD